MLETAVSMLDKSTSLKGERRKAKEKSLQKLLQDIKPTDSSAEEDQEANIKSDLSKKFVGKLVPELPVAHPKFPSFR